MYTPSLYPILALLAATASTRAQSTGTATVLVPDWCVTQATPTVTATGQGDLTTYSYYCPGTSGLASSVSARASSVLQSAKSRADAIRSSVLNDPRETDSSRDGRRDFDVSNVKRQDDTCYEWGAFDGCIPWEVTQGASTWAVHYTRTGNVALDQECTFGDGGVASGSATCTASGRLDPQFWGNGDDSRTRTFAKSDVDRLWIRNAVPVTSGGGPLPTNSAAVTTGPGAIQSAGIAAPRSIPTGAVAMVAGAGGILAAALVL